MWRSGKRCWPRRTILHRSGTLTRRSRRTTRRVRGATQLLNFSAPAPPRHAPNTARALKHLAEAKTIAMGQKLDLVFSSLRLGIFFEDWHLVKARLAKSQKIFEMGADWERKNRLKVRRSGWDGPRGV